MKPAACRVRRSARAPRRRSLRSPARSRAKSLLIGAGGILRGARRHGEARRRRYTGAVVHGPRLSRPRPGQRMHIGLPKEIKDGEYRVALTPVAAGALVRAGHDVTVQPGAGAGAGFADAQYAAAGAQLGDAWVAALVVKVKELQASEYGHAVPGQTVFRLPPLRARSGAARGGARLAARPSSLSRPWARPIAACRSSRRCPRSRGASRCRSAPGSCRSTTAAPACCCLASPTCRPDAC